MRSWKFKWQKIVGNGIQYSTNLAADICLPKMVAGLLSHPKRQFYSFENKRHPFYLYYENSRWHFTNENASRITLTEQIFTETSHLVPLKNCVDTGAKAFAWLIYAIFP